MESSPGMILHAADDPIQTLYFLESGLASVVVPDVRIELGMIGREGLVGAAPVLLGSDRTPHECMVHMKGDMYRISVADMRAAFGRSVSLRTVLLRYVHSLLTQIGQTVLSNTIVDLDGRLARWILMCRDRTDGDVLITHRTLARMLGVSRPGVSITLKSLESDQLIQTTRGRILVRDRAALETLAGDGYGVAEAEYRRLIPAPER